MSSANRRGMVISSRWLQGVVRTFAVGFGILGYLALRVYEDHAPVPDRVVSEAGEVLFTGEDILQGQVAFLTYGLMEYGSIYGHGAYLGPDFTADYLHRQALAMREQYGGGADCCWPWRPAWLRLPAACGRHGLVLIHAPNEIVWLATLRRSVGADNASKKRR